MDSLSEILERNATQRNRRDPEKPIGEPLYLRVDFVSTYKVFLKYSASASSPASRNRIFNPKISCPLKIFKVV